MTILGQKISKIFELLLHKINFFGEKTGSIWIVPSDLFAKKIHFSFHEVVESKFEN